MKFSRTISLLVACTTFSCVAFAADADAEKKEEKGKDKKAQPGLLTRIWGTIHKPSEKTLPSAIEAERRVGKHRLQLSLAVEPDPVKLTDARQFKVILHVANKTKKLVQLEFPTTQRIEVLVKNPVGKLVEQWSEDRSFANEPGMVSINPGEHLEYTAMLSTRDLVAGEAYTIEAFFPNYEPLRLQKTVTAVK